MDMYAYYTMLELECRAQCVVICVEYWETQNAGIVKMT